MNYVCNDFIYKYVTNVTWCSEDASTFKFYFYVCGGEAIAKQLLQ